MTVNLNNTAPMQSHFGVYALIVDSIKAYLKKHGG